jgi:hypothetical protein
MVMLAPMMIRAAAALGRGGRFIFKIRSNMNIYQNDVL